MIRPEVLTACGKPPAGLATAPAADDRTHPRGEKLTPQQLAVQRADSARKAREQAKEDSLKTKAELARQDSRGPGRGRLGPQRFARSGPGKPRCSGRPSLTRADLAIPSSL